MAIILREKYFDESLQIPGPTFTFVEFYCAQAADNPTQKLHSLFDRDWEYQMQHDPVGGFPAWRPALERSVGDVSLGSQRQQFSIPMTC